MDALYLCPLCATVRNDAALLQPKDISDPPTARHMTMLPGQIARARTGEPVPPAVRRTTTLLAPSPTVRRTGTPPLPALGPTAMRRMTPPFQFQATRLQCTSTQPFCAFTTGMTACQQAHAYPVCGSLTARRTGTPPAALHQLVPVLQPSVPTSVRRTRTLHPVLVNFWEAPTRGAPVSTRPVPEPPGTRHFAVTCSSCVHHLSVLQPLHEEHNVRRVSVMISPPNVLVFVMQVTHTMKRSHASARDGVSLICASRVWPRKARCTTMSVQ